MVRSIDHRAKDVKSRFETSRLSFETELRYVDMYLDTKAYKYSGLMLKRGVRGKALGSNESSFVLREMIPAYRKAVSYKGK